MEKENGEHQGWLSSLSERKVKNVDQKEVENREPKQREKNEKTPTKTSSRWAPYPQNAASVVGTVVTTVALPPNTPMKPLAGFSNLIFRDWYQICINAISLFI